MVLGERKTLAEGTAVALPADSSILVVPSAYKEFITDIINGFLAHVNDELKLAQAITHPFSAAKLAGSTQHLEQALLTQMKRSRPLRYADADADAVV